MSTLHLTYDGEQHLTALKEPQRLYRLTVPFNYSDAFLAENFSLVKVGEKRLAEYPPEWAESITGVDAKLIEQAALWYAKADRGAIYYTLGITEHICGVDNVQSLCNLALMTGHVGREGTGINPMRGQNNIQGAGDCGALPNNYPGFQSVEDPANQAKFAAVIDWAKHLVIPRGGN